MYTSIQPRDALKAYGDRRYGFIIDSRDFCAATERAVQQSVGNEDNPALEHIIEVANKTPEICVIIDDRGYVSAWGLENIGCKAKSPSDVFNILHVEGLNFSFVPGVAPEEDYAQFSVFGSSTSEGSLALLVHYFDGRIEWLDSKVDTFFDPTPRQNRLTSRGIWSGHTAPIKKIVRNASGHVLVSRTDDNNAMIWRQKTHNAGSVLVRQSSMFSDEHIHRTCVIGNGKFLVNLHHESISLWDVRSCHAERLALCDFQLSSKLLCILLIPTADRNADLAYVATVGADMNGIAWEIHLPSNDNQMSNANGSCVHLREFCKFSLGLEDDLSYILPVDPAGQQTKISGFLDLFAADIALSYTLRGTIHTWAAKVDRDNAKIEWLLTSTVETGIANLSLASGSSIRKAAVVDEGRTHLTIWDTSCGQLEFEEHFSPYDIIRDLDWTSTPDMQSILAVGFPHKVILLSQLRYDYLDSGPSWTQVREIWICDLTPHPIGDSCWLSGGNLVVGAGNQLFVYDKEIEINNRLVAELRIPSHGNLFVDLFDVVSRLNGPLPVFHPQFLAQCILGGKMNLVHYILMCLHQKLKFYVEGDELDSFLELPLENFYRDSDVGTLPCFLLFNH
jgi:WD40 repeat protein